MADNTLDYFKIMITAMLFWSFVFTTLTYVIPVDDRPVLVYVEFSDGTTDLATIKSEFDLAVTQQTEIPLVDLGALLFYSGNIIIDLLLNFAFAIPQMFTILLNIIFLVIPVLPELSNAMSALIFAMIAVAYAIAILQFVTNLRGGNIA